MGKVLKKWWWTVLVFAMFLGAVASTVWYWPQPLVSPLISTDSFQLLFGDRQKHTPKIVYGFLPYWNVDKATVQPELTHLAYFGANISANGKLGKDADGNRDIGVSRMSSDLTQELIAKTAQQHKPVQLVLTQMTNGDIESFLANPSAHQQLIRDLDQMATTFPISGVNIDIEYVGDATPAMRQQLVTFVKTLNQHLKATSPKMALSIDVYAGAVKNQQIWDIAALEPYIDHFIVMAYDFHRPSSIYAGPVAPIFGGKTKWQSDVITHMQEFVKVVPTKKLLLGVPFYGYEWQTTSAASLASVYPGSGSTASFRRVQELLSRKDELQIQERWDEEALAPYLLYMENKKQYVVYFENSRSLSYKLDLANQLDLGGIAIWALGYEDNSRELWDAIHQKFFTQ